MLVGAAKPASVNDAASPERSRLKSKRCCRGNRVRIYSNSTASPAHTAGVDQPRLPWRQDDRRSQREKPLSVT